MATDGAISGPAKSTPALLKQMGHIVPWTLMASISNGMVSPLGPFLALNYFSQQYTDLAPSDIHCELDSSVGYCQQALIDGSKLVTALAFIAPLCQFLTLPLVGVLSDGFGRKRTILLTYCCSNLALLFADLVIFFNCSFWLSVAVTPFLNEQVITIVLNAAIGDILDKPSRATGIGIITALDTIAYVIGLLIGLHLGMRTSYIVASGFCLVSIAYLVRFFPETLPEEKRSFVVDRKSLVPWAPLPLLWRTSVLWRLTIATALAAFIDSGTGRVMPFYYQRRMPWSARDGYSFESSWDFSLIFWFTVLFNKIVAASGELGALAVGRVATILYVIPAVMATHPWQAFVNAGMFAGPMSFALPAVAGMKSRLVGESEQGRMQAALSTVFVVCNSLGQIVFGGLFQSMGDPSAPEAEGSMASLGQTIVISNAIFALCILFVIFGLSKMVTPGGCIESASITAETAAEDSSYGSTEAGHHRASW